MGRSGADERLRSEVCEAYAEWLRLLDVPAWAVRPRDGQPPRILRSDGSWFSADIAPRRGQEHMVGNMAVAAIRDELNANNDRGRARAYALRLVCSRGCGADNACHGDALAAVAQRLVADKDATVAANGPVKARQVRSDKGRKRGPRRVKGGSAYRIGMLSLYRYRYGMERQVSQRTRDAVAVALVAGVQPWLADGQAAVGVASRAEARCIVEADVAADSCGMCVEGDEAGVDNFEDGGEMQELGMGEAVAEAAKAAAALTTGAGGDLQLVAEAGTPRRHGNSKVSGARRGRQALYRRLALQQQRDELLAQHGERDHDDVDLGWLGSADAEEAVPEEGESRGSTQSAADVLRAAADTVMAEATETAGVAEAAAAGADRSAAAATPSRAGSSAEQAVPSSGQAATTPGAGSSRQGEQSSSGGPGRAAGSGSRDTPQSHGARKAANRAAKRAREAAEAADGAEG